MLDPFHALTSSNTNHVSVAHEIYRPDKPASADNQPCYNWAGEKTLFRANPTRPWTTQAPPWIKDTNLLQDIASGAKPLSEGFDCDWSPLDSSDDPGETWKTKKRSGMARKRLQMSSHYFKCRNFLPYTAHSGYDAPWWVAQGNLCHKSTDAQKLILGCMMPVDKNFQRQLLRRDLGFIMAIEKYKRWWFHKVAKLQRWINLDEQNEYDRTLGFLRSRPQDLAPPPPPQDSTVLKCS